jgi:ABC-type sugar transport system ATPase subunit
MHLKNFELPVSTLSGGNQQKVVIGRAISSSPTILLLDEPTRGVDVGARAEVFAMIKELLEGGMSIVLASSDMVELRALSHSIMVLHDRSPVATLDASEATEERLAILMSGGSLVG